MKEQEPAEFMGKPVQRSQRPQTARSERGRQWGVGVSDVLAPSVIRQMMSLEMQKQEAKLISYRRS